MHSNIEFTIELESDNSINFLDLNIRRESYRHVFSIFHKPSHTDLIINAKSYHPKQHKLAAFNSMIHRLVNTPMTEADYNKELNIIKQIAINNNFKVKIVEDILKHKTYKKTMNLIYPQTNKIKQTIYHKITYLGKHTNKILSKLKCK